MAKFWILTSLRLLFSRLNNGEICVICGKKTLINPLCKDCIDKFYGNCFDRERRVCSFCGRKLIVEKELCTTCRERRVVKNADRVISLYEYRLWNKDLLFMWKIEGYRSLSALFAGFCWNAIKDLKDYVVVPVPPRKGKIREKSWDQVDELCSFLHYRYNQKVMKLLTRNSTGEQKKLGREGRLETIGKAYSLLEEENLPDVMPENVIIIDDIFTTGSTIESCARVLKEGGVKKVIALTIFTAA